MSALGQNELESSQTFSLIGSDMVQGTEVYSPDGEHLGTVEKLMIDKISGRVSYAVMSFGGFLGIGEEYHPLPWETLHYDEGLRGYVVNVTRVQLEEAPRYEAGAEPEWGEAYGRRIHDHYGVAFPPMYI